MSLLKKIKLIYGENGQYSTMCCKKIEYFKKRKKNEKLFKNDYKLNKLQIRAPKELFIN